MGDGFLATFDGPARAIRCALAISRSVGTLGIAVRSGIHTGECEIRASDIGGIAVHIGARVAGMARAGEVLVSGAVKDLVFGSGIRFVDRGSHALPGVPGVWSIFAVVADEAAETVADSPPTGHGVRRIRLGDTAATALVRRAPSLVRFLTRLSSRRRT